VCGAWLSACGAAALETQPLARVAPSVDPPPVEPASTLPSARDGSRASDGVVTLRTPAARDGARALVARFFAVLHAKSIGDLEAEIDETVYDVRDGAALPMPRATMLEALKRTVTSLPYDQLDLDATYRPADVEIYAPDELGVPGRPARIAALHADELLVRVPILTPRLGADVLFREEMMFVLRRAGGRYRLAGWSELAPR
jgi:hypothetical protein